MTERAVPPRLPVTWRPRRARVVAYGLAVVVVVGAVLLAVALPGRPSLFDRFFVVVFGLLVGSALHLLGRLRVQADERGVTVVNPLRVHRFEWPEIFGVTMGVGDPWPRLDLFDGRSVGAMGIQSTERERARRAVAELSALIREYGEAAEPPR